MKGHIMTIQKLVQIMAIIGIPSLSAMAVYFGRACVTFSKKVDTLMSAVQKQMRRDLMDDYHKYMSQGYIEDDDLELWEASYQSYHSLGKNGVMDSKRADLMELPNEKPE